MVILFSLATTLVGNNMTWGKSLLGLLLKQDAFDWPGKVACEDI